MAVDKAAVLAAKAQALAATQLSPPSAPPPPPPCPPPARTALTRRAAASIAHLSHGIIERDVEARLLLLAAVAREHVLLIGPPGTAKSLLCSRLADPPFFSHTLTRFTVPEELFGPLSMRALEEDKYVRCTNGYLPTASVAILDEVFNASSAVLNTLLAIMQVGASNAVPDSDELLALYDRFLLRVDVRPLTYDGTVRMLQAQCPSTARHDAPPTHDRLPIADADAIRRAALSTVRIPPPIIAALVALRTHLTTALEPPIPLSDRRLRRGMQLLQVAAYLDGRDAVAELDLVLLQHVLWHRLGERERVAQWVVGRLAHDAEGGQRETHVLQALFGEACTSLGDAAALASVSRKLAAMQRAAGEAYRAATAAAAALEAAPCSLWVPSTEAAALQCEVLPRLSKRAAALAQVLQDAILLQVALEDDEVDRALLAKLLPTQWRVFAARHPMHAVRTRRVGALLGEQQAQYFRRPFI